MARLVVCDVDGVLVDGQTQERLLYYLFYRRQIGFFLFFTVYAWFFLYKIRLVSDVISIRRFAFRAFSNWPREKLDAMFDDFFETQVRPQIRPALLTFLAQRHAQGDIVVLATATLKGISTRIARLLGFEDVIATELEFVRGVCTGAIQGNVPYGNGKLAAVDQYLSTRGFDWKRTTALSDHISDAGLLEKAGEPIAVCPEPRLRALAIQKGWLIHDFS